MITFDIEDTVTFHRPPVGEETRILSVYANHNMPRRSAGSGKAYTAQSALAFVGSTGDLPIIGIPAPAYTPRHLAKEDAEIVSLAPAESVPPFAPSPLRRLIARLGRVGGAR